MGEEPYILVIEDDPSIAEVVTMALEDSGYVVATASDGYAGLQAAQQQLPALILLDMRMPFLDGPGFVEAYRQLPPPHAPIVLLSAGHEAEQLAGEMQTAGVLAKPFDLSQLLDTVERFVLP